MHTPFIGESKATAYSRIIEVVVGSTGIEEDEVNRTFGWAVVAPASAKGVSICHVLAECGVPAGRLTMAKDARLMDHD